MRPALNTSRIAVTGLIVGVTFSHDGKYLFGSQDKNVSLWSVPDQKTTQLMRQFYLNVWDRKLSKLEALRDAQLWLMRQPNQTAGNPATSNSQIASGAPNFSIRYTLGIRLMHSASTCAAPPIACK